MAEKKIIVDGKVKYICGCDSPRLFFMIGLAICGICGRIWGDIKSA